VTPGLEGANVSRRTRTGDRQDPLDRLHHARHTSKRQRRSDEPDHFSIVIARIAADDVDGIGGGVGIVELRVQTVEHLFERCHPGRS
jgi:hypothetical protein